jgi:hypothetical protein
VIRYNYREIIANYINALCDILLISYFKEVCKMALDNVILAIIIGTLAAIVYSLRVLVLLERRIARMDENIEKMAGHIEKEAIKIEAEELKIEHSMGKKKKK